MEVFKNKVGRPSNETLRKRKIIKISIVTLIVLLIGGCIFALSGFDFKKLSNATGVSSSNVVQLYFLNTLNRETVMSGWSNSTAPVTGDATVIATQDGKYILIDTGNKNSKVRSVIYSRLARLQGKKKGQAVRIDYMIVTHLHGDHAGNASAIVKDTKNFNVGNVIIKNEYYHEVDAYNRIRNFVYGSNNIHGTRLITVDEQSDDAGMITLDVGKYLTLYLFNTEDVYEGESRCVDSSGKMVRGYAIKYNTRVLDTSNFGTKQDPIYVYRDNDNIPKVTKSYPVSGKGKVYYAYKKKGRYLCNANANSIATLIKVKTNKTSKYMYFPGDLENNGYPIDGSTEYTFISKYNGQTKWSTRTVDYSQRVYGNGATIIYKDNNISVSGKTAEKAIFSGEAIEPVTAAQETHTARKIVDLVSNVKGNIVIYQSAHHGNNNAKDAINTLDLNRSNVRVIATVSANPKSTSDFLMRRSYHSTFSNVSAAGHYYYVGSTNNYEKYGVTCKISLSGGIGCTNYGE